MSLRRAPSELRCKIAVALRRNGQDLLGRVENNPARRDNGHLLTGGLRIKPEPDGHGFGARHEGRIGVTTVRASDGNLGVIGIGPPDLDPRSKPLNEPHITVRLNDRA